MSKKTTVVNLLIEEYDVYIGRAGKGQVGYFGNPFSRHQKGETRTTSIDKFRKYFYNRLSNDKMFKSKIDELKGKTLGCFCKPASCHGDIIAEYLNSGQCII